MACLTKRTDYTRLRNESRGERPPPKGGFTMRLRNLARCSVSLAVLAAATSPAWAQDAPAGTGAAATPAADGSDDAIVVTGLRSSLRSAQNIKRNSDQII